MYESSDEEDAIQAQPAAEPVVEVVKTRKPYQRKTPLTEEQKDKMRERLALARAARAAKKAAEQPPPMPKPTPPLPKPKLTKAKQAEPVTYSRAAESIATPNIVYNFYGQPPTMPTLPTMMPTPDVTAAAKPKQQQPLEPPPVQRTRLSYATW